MEYIIHNIESDYLRKYSNSFISEFQLILNNEQIDFEPYRIKPQHYTISIYEPLNLSYVVLGNRNYVIDLNFEEDDKMSAVIRTYCKINNCDEIAFRREIEYSFLKVCQEKISVLTGIKFQLYLTQHITEVSYNITDMKPIQIGNLMDILEQ